MTQRYLCNCCGKQSDQPHGCQCGGDNIPSEPLPDELLLDDAAMAAIAHKEDEDELD